MSKTLSEQIRIKAGMMQMGEKIAWGSDTALMEQAADEIDRLKSELAEARKVPEGWKLVPVELTKEMGIFVCNCDAQQQFWSLNISECYHAMLDAAPEYKP